MQPGSSEFVVLSANEDGKAGRVETSVFVIQRLVHPKTFKETFYVVSGTVYQAPELSELLRKALGQSASGALCRAGEMYKVIRSAIQIN